MGDPMENTGTAPALSVRGVGVSFGGVRALDGVDIDVQPGEIVGLIGASALSASQDALDRGRWEKAEDEARKASDWWRWSPEPWQRLGEAQLGAGDTSAAAASFRKAVSKDRQDWLLWHALASVTDGAESRRASGHAARLNRFYRQDLEEGRPPWEAVLESTVRRFRPIVLTAAAAIFAMVPLSRIQASSDAAGLSEQIALGARQARRTLGIALAEQVESGSLSTAQAEAVAAALGATDDPRLPASCVHGRHETRWWVDASAAARIEV